MDGWVDGWMDRWREGGKEGERIERRTDGQMGFGLIDGWRQDRQMDGWMD